MTGTIIITGAGSGIGRATAERFVGAGWSVGLVGRRVDRLEAVAAAVEPDRRADVLVLAGDIADEEFVQSMVEQFVARYGRLDALFNNAGIFTRAGTIDEISVEDWRRSVDTNLTGAFLCARAAFAAMRAQDPQGGRIINNGSISAHVPRPGSAPYTSTKHALTGLTRTISLDGRPYNIACGQIDIGNAFTEMVAGIASGAKQADGSIRPEATMDVSHIADAVLQMASLPLDANIQFMTIMATAMPFIGRG
ncbi:MAG: SDR family NAD(P)-dependent oxidoreductase [Actinomycetota bacterium]|nr:SDR family NAD(P)-dependent oxidoreductase [Actinomycetota bacterium]